jgi:hypothetical protein
MFASLTHTMVHLVRNFCANKLIGAKSVDYCSARRAKRRADLEGRSLSPPIVERRRQGGHPSMYREAPDA